MTRTANTLLKAALLSSILLTQSNVQANNERYQQGVASMEQGNFAEAFCIWKPLANQGHIEAQYSIGWMYANGYGLKLNEAEGVRWWKLAANRGHPDAQFAVAMAYLYGEGVKRSRAETVKWLLKASSNNVDDAQTILRDMAGRGKKEAEEAIRDNLKDNWQIFGPTRKIKADRANVRNVPGTSGSKIIITLEKGTEVITLTRKGDWYRIGIVGTKKLGWLYDKLLAPKEKEDE